MEKLRNDHRDAPQWVQRIIDQILEIENALIAEHEFLLETEVEVDDEEEHPGWATIDRAILGLYEYDRQCAEFHQRAENYAALQLYLRETRVEIQNLIRIYESHVRVSKKTIKEPKVAPKVAPKAAPKETLKEDSPMKKASTPPSEPEVTAVVSKSAAEEPVAPFPHVLPPAPVAPPTPEPEHEEGEEFEGFEDEEYEEEEPIVPVAPVAPDEPIVPDVAGNQYRLIAYGGGYARRLPRRRRYPF
ncbi:hypothetical protein F4776DRAFT_637945 [Hypoxylon sp. NC0597]|nr:hypothetical protein F4776DRAFT_637945 [Hypoxylon sp. NC0597]